MANEISYRIQISLVNGGLQDNFSPSGLTADQASAAMVKATQNIGTSHAALGLGSVVTPGFAVFQNLDATNFVELGIDDAATFEPFAKLKPGEIGMIRLTTTAPYARANTAAIDLFYVIYED